MAKAKGAPRSRAWWDGYEHLTPKEFGPMRSPESDRYAADYEAGALARDQAHERLNKVCADARRMDVNQRAREAELRQRPVVAEFMGEARVLMTPAALAQT